MWDILFIVCRRNIYKMFVGETEETRPLGRSRHR
jgi:hypothetical protein